MGLTDHTAGSSFSYKRESSRNRQFFASTSPSLHFLYYILFSSSLPTLPPMWFADLLSIILCLSRLSHHECVRACVCESACACLPHIVHAAVEDSEAPCMVLLRQ
jgi:hypothetical protein